MQSWTRQDIGNAEVSGQSEGISPKERGSDVKCLNPYMRKMLFFWGGGLLESTAQNLIKRIKNT